MATLRLPLFARRQEDHWSFIVAPKTRSCNHLHADIRILVCLVLWCITDRARGCGSACGAWTDRGHWALAGQLAHPRVDLPEKVGRAFFDGLLSVEDSPVGTCRSNKSS